MSLAAYHGIGGVAGALSARADRLYEARDEDGRRVIEQVFLRLVRLGEGRQDTRRRVTRAELHDLEVDPAGVDEVLDAYGRHRFLTFDREPATREPTVEIAHEALLTAWGRLARWIDDARDDLRQEQRLARAASEWNGADRDPSFLVTGARLSQLEAWAASSRISPGTLEREYLAASVQRREGERAADEEREARERQGARRSRRLLQGLVAVLALGVLAASTLTIVAVGERRDTARQSRIAFARELAAASLASLDVDAERSMLLALQAIETTRASDGTVLPEAEEALHRAVTSSRILLTARGVGGALDWSPDGSMFVTEGPDESGIIDIRDPETGASIRSFPGHDPDVNSVAFSHDGSMLATTGDDGALRVWDPQAGTELQSFDHGDGVVVAPAFSPDDRLVAAAWEGDGDGGDDGDGGSFVEIRDVASGRAVQRLGPFLSVRSAGISFSPDGRRLVVPTAGATVVADVRTGDEVLALTVGDDDIATDADWSPDGRWIATSHGDGTVRVFEAQTGTQLYRLFAHRTRIWSMDWSPDSTLLATAGADGTAKVWEISDEGARGSLTLNDRDGSGVIGLAFSSDGDRLMTGDLAVTTVRIWDVTLSGDAEWSNVSLPEDVGIAFTEGGGQLITSAGEEAWLRDLETGDRAGTLAADRPTDPWPFHRIEVAPDGTIASAGIDVGVWQPDGRFVVGFDGRQWFDEVDWSGDGRFLAMRDQRTTTIVDRSWDVIAEFPGERGFVGNAVALNADGSLAAVASERLRRPDPTTAKVTIWDVARNEVLRELPAFGHDVAFDPTGTRIATASIYGVADIWDVRSGEHLASLSGHAGEITAVRFSPDGSILATGGSDGTVRTWDPASGAPLLVLEGHGSEVVRLAFDPGGSKLASAGNEGVARIWALDLDDLIEIAHEELTRGFTDAECRQYLHLGACPAP